MGGGISVKVGVLSVLFQETFAVEIFIKKEEGEQKLMEKKLLNIILGNYVSYASLVL